MDNIKQCIICSNNFKIIAQEHEFLNSICIDDPIVCPKCRQNIRAKYSFNPFMEKDKCNACDKVIFNPYKKDLRKIYCSDCFSKNRPSPQEFQREYDYNKPFVNQFMELYNSHPIRGIDEFETDEINANKVRSNEISYSTNSYDCFDLSKNLDSVDVQHSVGCSNCVSCTFINGSENCLNCSHLASCRNCFECKDSQQLENCYFCDNCKNTKNCFGCANLRNEEFCIFNIKYSEDQYYKELEILLNKTAPELYTEVSENKKQFPIPSHVFFDDVEDCIYANNVTKSSKLFYAFDVYKINNGGYLWHCESNTDLWDASVTRRLSNSYMCADCSYGENNAFCFDNYETNNCYLCYKLSKSNNCIGCIGREKSYSILNKQYSEEEYNKIKDKILKEGFNDLYKL